MLLNKSTKDNQKIVWSCNEWDPLEEVIVGSVEGAIVPVWDQSLAATTPSHAKWFFEKYGGKPFPEVMVDCATKELDGLVKTLEKEGVIVRRPEVKDAPSSAMYETPWWKSHGLYAAMPRDIIIVIGDIMVEAPMAWRSRYFEIFAYRKLMKEYFDKGAKWLVAPKPSMSDSFNFYNADYDPCHATIGGVKQFVISENEIAFDAADFVRFGTDILVQKSNVTNSLGIEWVRRHIGSEYTIHEVNFSDEHPMHIDTTIVPLGPGKLLINPSWVDRKDIPKMFDSWEIIEAPAPVNAYDAGLYFSSDWLTMNFLSIDNKKIIVEEQEEPLMKLLSQHGFTPIPIPFRHFYPFGGSMHCATTDIRRRGELKSYFN